MTTRFDSFDSSTAEGFVESPMRARNRGVPPTGVNDPIIFILPTVQTLSVRQYVVEYMPGTGWPGPIPWLFGREIDAEPPLYYSVDPDAFERDVADMEAAWAEHEAFDYGDIGKRKPNWNVQIWQPTSSELTAHDFYFITHYAPGTDISHYNNDVGPNKMAIFNSNESEHLLVGPNHTGDPPRTRVYRIPLNTMPSSVHVFASQFGPIEGYRDGPAGGRVTSMMPIGPYTPRLIDFVPQRSLIDMWIERQRQYESISQVWLHPDEHYNSQVFIYTPQENAYRQFTYAWTSLSYGQPGLPPGVTPLSALRNYLEETLPEELQPVRVTIRSGGTRWPVNVAGIIRDRMRG